MSHEVHKCWRGWPQSGMNIIEIRSVWDTISSYFILDLQTTEHEALLSEQVLVQTRWWSDTVQSHNIITTSAGLQLVLAELARSGSKGSSLWESNLLKPSFSLACRAKPWQLPHEPLLAYLTRHSRPKKKSGTSSLHYVYIYIYIHHCKCPPVLQRGELTTAFGWHVTNCKASLANNEITQPLLHSSMVKTKPVQGDLLICRS